MKTFTESISTFSDSEKESLREDLYKEITKVFMGWYPVNTIKLVRDSNTREIIVTWRDDILGDLEKRFTWEQKEEALNFAKKEFNSLCM